MVCVIMVKLHAKLKDDFTNSYVTCMNWLYLNSDIINIIKNDYLNPIYNN